MFKVSRSLNLCCILFTCSSILAAEPPGNHWKLDSIREACALGNAKAFLEKRNAGERPEIVALRNERNAKALALLTAEQKKA